MRINSNIDALNTYRQYTRNSTAVSKSMEKLSSGLRINHASDDAAGLAISEKMKAQVSGLKMASKNSQDAISLAQTSEGALTETQSILQRMRELAVQSASDTNQDTDRDALQSEFSQLTSEIDDISSQTTFNHISLLDGRYASNKIGAGSDAAFTDATVSTNGAAVGSYAITYTGPAYDAAKSDLKIDTDVTDIKGSVAGTYTLSKNSDGSNVDVTGPDGKKITGTMTGTTFTAGNLTITAKDLATLFGKISTDQKVTIDAATTTINKDGAGAVNGTIDEQGNAVFADAHITVKNAATTLVSGSKTLKMEAGNALTVQTGAEQGQTLDIHIEKMDARSLGFDSSVKISDLTDAQNAITTIDSAIKTVSDQRGTLGALENRLDHKINNLDTSTENLSAAQSRIADVDMASEMVEYTKDNILVQASQAMLAQAKSQPQSVLQLLQQ